jgi:hypothetical protein
LAPPAWTYAVLKADDYLCCTATKAIKAESRPILELSPPLFQTYWHQLPKIFRKTSTKAATWHGASLFLPERQRPSGHMQQPNQLIERRTRTAASSPMRPPSSTSSGAQVIERTTNGRSNALAG